MAHEITEHDWLFSGSGKTPWHGLGTVTEGALSLDDALTTARLDWTVSRQPMFVMTASGVTQVPDKFAIVRDDIGLPLGVCGKVYKEFQNAEGFSLLGALLEGGDVDVETAGSLAEGRYVWALARLHRDLRINGIDKHVPYVLFTTGHDGGTATRLLTMPVRVVCRNTLRMALDGSSSSWVLRHTTFAKRRVDEARRALGLAWAYYDAFEDEVERLVAQSVTDRQFGLLVADLFPIADDAGAASVTRTENVRGVLHGLWAESPTVGEFRGTAWGAVQAFSTYDLWQRPTRGGDNAVEQQAMRVISGRTEAFDKQVRERVAALA